MSSDSMSMSERRRGHIFIHLIGIRLLRTLVPSPASGTLAMLVYDMALAERVLNLNGDLINR